MFQRSIIAALQDWKESENRKPLVLRGARQVGKTTVINEFGKRFDNYLYFNMENPTHFKLFEMDVPLQEMLPLLFGTLGLERKAGSVLIFIDEIQESPKAISRLRYFYEQLPELHVIAAGSLLENIVDVKESFPVGRVQYMALRPCSFKEFVGALGKGSLLNAITQPEYSQPFHSELMYLFQQYMLVGGMPEAVDRYARHRDLLALDDLFDTLIQAYKDDAEKYVKGNKMTETVRFLLSYGWAFAGQTVTLAGFAGSAYKSREVGEAFRLLEKAMLLELVYPTSSPALPIVPQTKRMPKLIWFDTGLVNFQAGVRNEIIGASDISDVWRGNIAEQVVAQELLALTNKVSQKRSFWAKANNGAEVDFVYLHNSKVYPIEVKNGHNAHLRSLQVFMQQSPADVAVRVWAKPYSVDKVKSSSGKEFKLINLPFYLLYMLDDILEKVEAGD